MASSRKRGAGVDAAIDGKAVKKGKTGDEVMSGQQDFLRNDRLVGEIHLLGGVGRPSLSMVGGLKPLEICIMKAPW